jgi:hypothetical protein
VPLIEGSKFRMVEPSANDGYDTEKIKQSRSQAVQIAAMLSQFASGCVERDALRLGFIYNANAPRSGKTLLTKLAVIPVNGRMATQAWNPKDEELRKVLDSAVIAASTYIVFDNVKGHVSSQVLEGFMTSRIWSGRVLGSLTKFESANDVTVFVTGNECTVSPDIANRCLMVDLFVNEADVQDRVIEDEFDDAWLMKRDNRMRILSCLWAIVRHWNAAGRPVAEDLRVRRGFASWCHTIGSMVAYAGFGDCLAAPIGENMGDTEGADMRAMVTALAATEAETTKRIEFTFQEIVNICHENGLFDWLLDGKEKEEGLEKDFVLKPESNSRFGIMLRRYAPTKDARVFRLTPELTVLMSCTGKNRQRRYVLTRFG